MKFNSIATFAILFSPFVFADPATDARAQRIQTLYQSGVEASQRGDVVTARVAFEGVLQMQPGHGHARYQIANLGQNKEAAQRAERLAQFKNTVIPTLDFNEAPLDEALVYLDQQAAERSGKKFSPNFILQDPDGVVSGRTLTLKLANVPLNVVLKYVEEMAGVVIRYDEFATVVTPRAKAGGQ